MLKQMGIGASLSLGAILVIGAGCVETKDVSSSGNDALGIARFQIDETATQTRVVGLDDAGQEVARLDLIHGQFALSGMFKDDYPGQSEVDGRKLEVLVGGERRFNWETAGYDPTLHMPAHPSSEAELIAFLDDPHVKAVLDRWQIGFESTDVLAEGEDAYYTDGITVGSSLYWCQDNSPTTQCGTARGFTINTCGGGTTPYRASRLTQTSPYNQYIIDQYCPPVTGISTVDWMGKKSCPTAGSGAQPSSCGTTGATAACKGCGGYPAATGAAAHIWQGWGGVYWCYGGLAANASCSADSQCCTGVCDGGTSKCCDYSDFLSWDCYALAQQCQLYGWPAGCDCAADACGFN